VIRSDTILLIALYSGTGELSRFQRSLRKFRSLTFVCLFRLSKHYTGRGAFRTNFVILSLIDADERLSLLGLMKRFDTVEQVAKEMNLPVDKVQGTFNDYMEIVKDPKKDPFGKKL